MNVPFTAMHFSVYEAAKKWLLHVDDGDEEAEDRLSVQLVAGGLRGNMLFCCGATCSFQGL
jgi:solute carrier family 25 iron transporter 28/37